VASETDQIAVSSGVAVGAQPRALNIGAIRRGGSKIRSNASQHSNLSCKHPGKIDA
jgi:hypothetical protein